VSILETREEKILLEFEEFPTDSIENMLSSFERD